MAADRQIPQSGTGPEFMSGTQEEVSRLYEGICIELTSIAGDENDITAVCTPALTDGLKAGMLFAFEVGASANTGAVTLKIGSETAVDVVDTSNTALVSGRLKASSRQVVFYSGVAAKFILLTDTRDTNRILDYQAFTASGTWDKPAGTPDDAWVEVELWGAGGAGSSATRGGGGGGGGYLRQRFRAADLASSVAITVGAGGTVGTTGVAGGNTSFGSHATAYGGGGGGNHDSSAGGGGGGGGGPAGGGANGGAASGGNDGGSGGRGGRLGGGGGGGGTGADALGSGGGASGGGNDGGAGTSTIGGDGGDAGPYGGGGGGGGSQGGGTDSSGGAAIWGGGGGAGDGGSSTAGTGGASLYGGNGGASGVAGSAPGGAGGRNAAGARGEARIWVIS